MNLRKRIERLYMALTGADRPRGAKAWLAEETGFSPRTVSAWCSAEATDNDSRTLPAKVAEYLSQREEEVGETRLTEAERLLDQLPPAASKSPWFNHDVQAMRLLVDLGYSLNQVAEAFDTGKDSVSRIYNRNRRADVPDPTGTERERVREYALEKLSAGGSTIEEPRGEIGGPAGDWSRTALEATVAIYFSMLESELKGETYVEAEHDRRLHAQQGDRSGVAVPLKHQHISGILLELGLPYVSGYPPLSNPGQLLLDVVEEQLAARGDLVLLVGSQVESEATVPSVRDLLDRLEDPPRRGEGRAAEPNEDASPFRIARRVDYLAQEARNASLGRAGEEFVANFERARLIRRGREALADRVEHVAVTQGDGLGFDVLSFEDDGSDRFIEVKTTAYGKETPFYVSDNELSFSLAVLDRYHLYRPFLFRKDPKLFTLAGPLEDTCQLLPSQYRARVK